MKGIFAFVACFCFQACTNDQAKISDMQRDREIIELKSKLEIELFRQEMSRAKSLSVDLNFLKNRRVELESDISFLADQKRLLQIEGNKLRENLPTHKRKLIEARRAKALDEFDGILTLKNGSSITGAVITKIDDSGVSFRHKEGIARFQCYELAAQEQAFFGLDAEMAQVAETILRERQNNYNKEQDLAAYKETIARKQAADARKLEESSQRAERISKVAYQPRPYRILSDSIGQLGSTNRVTSSFYSYSRPRFYGSCHSIYRPYQSAQSNCTSFGSAASSSYYPLSKPNFYNPVNIESSSLQCSGE